MTAENELARIMAYISLEMESLTAHKKVLIVSKKCYERPFTKGTFLFT